jgi:Transglutaminase-like superfamily
MWEKFASKAFFLHPSPHRRGAGGEVLFILCMAMILSPLMVWAQSPAESPNVIVIRPKAPKPEVGPKALVYPDKPGFITIRPRGSGSQLVGTTTASPMPVLANAIKVPAVMPQAPEAKLEPDDGKIVFEVWYATFLRNIKAGYYHVVVREYTRDGKTFRYATKTQKLQVARFGQPAEIWGEDSTMETPEGQVLTTRMRQVMGKNQTLTLTGKAIGNKLQVQVEGMMEGKETIPFPEGVMGIAKEATFFADKKPKVGDTLEYRSWEGRVNRVVKFTAVVKSQEELVIYTGQPARKVLKIHVEMEKVDNYQLPPGTIWVDAVTFETLRMDADDPNLGGKVSILRTTQEFALKTPTKFPELNEVQSIPLPNTIADIHAQREVTYSFRFKPGYDGTKAFPRDDRQSLGPVALSEPPMYTVRIQAQRAPDGPAPAANVGPEFLSESYFIDWNKDLVKDHAKAAIYNLPATASAWQRAKAVELWVQKNMKAAEFSQAMASCAATAKNLSGDCTEYAMLAAGMCRALGVPSRTAMGLVYALDRKGQPMLAYHMWFEVFVEGRWMGLDATLGRGGVGPGHLKITDHSWFEEKSLAPLLPVMGVLGSEPKVSSLEIGKPR